MFINIWSVLGGILSNFTSGTSTRDKRKQSFISREPLIRLHLTRFRNRRTGNELAPAIYIASSRVRWSVQIRTAKVMF